MKYHLCMLICFNNTEHIKQCFLSLKNDFTDFFIIENYSSNSPEIKQFFIEQHNAGARIIRYIQFEKNITNNVVTVFHRDFFEVIKQYEYITYSDCDVLVDSSKSAFTEIFSNLEDSDVFVSAVDLSLDNLPKTKETKKWLPKIIAVTPEYIECYTGTHLMTFRNKDLNFFVQAERPLDAVYHKIAKSIGKKWVKTLRTKAKHLTWDLYNHKSPYLDFKHKNKKELWNHSHFCNYKIII